MTREKEAVSPGSVIKQAPSIFQRLYPLLAVFGTLGGGQMHENHSENISDERFDS